MWSGEIPSFNDEPLGNEGGELNGILLQLSWGLNPEGIRKTLEKVAKKKDRQAFERQVL